MRTLHLVPIVHTEADLGQLAERVRRATRLTQGRGVWARKQALASELWRAIRNWCDQLPPALAGWTLYQDGLPVCGREADIVRDLAAKGSDNHRLLLELVARGASLLGTESGELLLAEYALARTIAEGRTPDASAASELLAQRDRFIADRIASTLPQESSAVLFIGALHDVRRFLPDDLTVKVADLSPITPARPATSRS
jgi:hypothetical protein